VMIICFVVDTSASMNQRIQSPNGLTLLDCAKASIEYFLKIRGRDINIRNDNYFLVTTENGPEAVKIGWRDNYEQFVYAVKQLRAQDCGDVSSALQRAFTVVNERRLITNVDTYGMGRTPWMSEQAAFIILVDGSHSFSPTFKRLFVQHLLLSAPSSVPDADLNIGLCRWDQRCFAFFLRFPSALHNDDSRSVETVQQETLAETNNNYKMEEQHEVSAICAQSGGRVAVCESLKHLLQHFDALANALLRPVIAVRIAPLPVSVGANAVSTMPPLCPPAVSPQLLAFPSSSPTEPVLGNWPFPEDCIWTQGLSALPPRSTQPLLRIHVATDAVPSVEDLPHFPYDRYTLESSPLTEWLLAHRLEPSLLLVSLVPDSESPREIAPFGYLRTVPNKSQVHFYVLPYNYPKLFRLLQQVMKYASEKTATATITASSVPAATASSTPPSTSIPPHWHHEFESYVSTLPHYYLPYLRKALKRCLADSVVAAHLLEQLNDQSFNSYPQTQALNRLRHMAKTELDQRDTLRRALRTLLEHIESAGSSSSSKVLSSSSAAWSAGGSGESYFEAWQVVRPHVVVVQRASLHYTLFRDQRVPSAAATVSTTTSLRLQSSLNAPAEPTGGFSLPDFHEVLKGRERTLESDGKARGSGGTATLPPAGSVSFSVSNTTRSSDERSNTPHNETDRIFLPAHVLPHSVVFDVDRQQLLDVLSRLRERLLQPYFPAKRRDTPTFAPRHPVDPVEAKKHSVPIAQMSNFQEVLRKRQSTELRNPEEEISEVPPLYFGNPFLKRKKGVTSIGETAAVDELATETQFVETAKNLSLKRKFSPSRPSTAERSRPKRPRAMSPAFSSFSSLSSPVSSSSSQTADLLDSVDFGVSTPPSSPNASSVSSPLSALLESWDGLSSSLVTTLSPVSAAAVNSNLHGGSLVPEDNVAPSVSRQLDDAAPLLAGPPQQSHTGSTLSAALSVVNSPHAKQHALRLRNNRRRWIVMQLIRTPPRRQQIDAILQEVRNFEGNVEEQIAFCKDLLLLATFYKLVPLCNALQSHIGSLHSHSGA